MELHITLTNPSEFAAIAPFLANLGQSASMPAPSSQGRAKSTKPGASTAPSESSQVATQSDSQEVLVPEAPAVEETSTFAPATPEEIRAAIAVKKAENAANSEKAKNMLIELGVTNVSSIPKEQSGEFLAKINAL